MTSRLVCVLGRVPAGLDPRASFLCAEPGPNEDLPGCKDQDLSPEEAASFREHGFLMKRGLIDPAKLTRIQDYAWSKAPPCLSRDPSSWATAADYWPNDPTEPYGRLVKQSGAGWDGSWKLRTKGDRLTYTLDGIAQFNGVGTEAWLLDLTANHPAVRAVARQLVGAPLRDSYRVRGIYSVFPKEPLPEDGEGKMLAGAHTDGHAGQLSAMVFVSDVPWGCGGFTVTSLEQSIPSTALQAIRIAAVLLRVPEFLSELSWFALLECTRGSGVARVAPHALALLELRAKPTAWPGRRAQRAAVRETTRESQAQHQAY